MPVKTSPTKSRAGQKIPEKALIVQKKQESSSEEESSDEDEPKAKVVVAKPPSKTPVKPSAKPALTKKQESSSEDSDDSKCVNLTCNECIFLHILFCNAQFKSVLRNRSDFFFASCFMCSV